MFESWLDYPHKLYRERRCGMGPTWTILRTQLPWLRRWNWRQARDEANWGKSSRWFIITLALPSSRGLSLVQQMGRRRWSRLAEKSSVPFVPDLLPSPHEPGDAGSLCPVCLLRVTSSSSPHCPVGQPCFHMTCDVIVNTHLAVEVRGPAPPCWPLAPSSGFPRFPLLTMYRNFCGDKISACWRATKQSWLIRQS